MMKLITPFFTTASLLFLVSACLAPQQSEVEQNETFATFKIAFGSCGHETHPLPVFDQVVQQKPDVFVFLGDNIYGDTYDMDTLKAKYKRLAAKPSFQKLKQSTPLIATWDDHDYGWNDIGRHYPFKEESKAIFMDFFDIPKEAPMRKRAGIYDAHYFKVADQTVQIVLLDMRTFRDDIKPYRGEAAGESRYFYPLDYTPYLSTETDSTLLGEMQWHWLEKELQKPADVRIIGTSTQFGITYNGYEAWANFPHERQRFIDLIARNKVNGVLFISGDVHYAEISKLMPDNTYPLYDVTSSGLSSTWHFATPNGNRIEGPVMENHFGLITLTFGKGETNIMMEIFDVQDNQRIEYSIPLSDLQF